MCTKVFRWAAEPPSPRKRGPQNLWEAARWHQRAAELAGGYRDGTSGPQNLREAARWHQRAAELALKVGLLGGWLDAPDGVLAQGFGGFEGEFVDDTDAI